MKNIHVLPTDKPSRLRVHECGQLYLSVNFTYGINDENKRNIYITSDEEDINENDYIITQDDKLFGVSYLLSKHIQGASKVVLTTDQDLIKDGVQAIDDEFLEWFVKNSSCDFVNVEVKFIQSTDNSKDGFYYIPIIPKEEAKPFKQMEKLTEVEWSKFKKNPIPNKKEEPKQETLEESIISAIKKLHKEKQETFEESKYKGKALSTEEVLANRSSAYEFIDFDKQETLEEVAEKYYLETEHRTPSCKKHFIVGAKWQEQKQDDYALDFVCWLMKNCKLIQDPETEENVLWRYDSEDYILDTLLEIFKDSKDEK